ncbi:FtsX-like permease family protein [Paenibacillus sp. FJAT-26967]|uniref:ABC transporter permease n=1 Tax=Paenibacillus sp. FJAT-26967 TaxID=1729690 RepID=UPI00083896DF|nr:FtsX-like permease family protein [Paenibacillus sp. FJAT-26967]
MYPIWLLCLSNLKRKKVQTVFIGLIIMLASLLFSTAIVVMNNTGSIYSDFHNRVNGSHELLRLEEGLHDPAVVHEWWEKQSGVTASEMMRYRYIAGYSHGDKAYPNTDLFMMDTPAGPMAVDQLVFVQGSQSPVPQAGTIWIPTSLAYANKINVGDTLSFQKDAETLQLRVSAVVVDIPYSSPFTSTSRIWMNTQDYTQYLSVMEGKDRHMMGLRFDNYSQSASYWAAFEKKLGTPYLESVSRFESLSSFYMITNKMIGFIMIFLAVFMIIVALYTVGFTISDAILSNYKTIGVLKSMGFTSGRTVGIYVIQYALLAVVAVVPGIVLSYFFSRTVVEMSLSYLRTPDSGIGIEFGASAVIVGLLIVATVIAAAYFFSNKARSIQPVQAIRFGMSEKDSAKMTRRMKTSGGRLFGFDRLPIPVSIGLRGVMKNIRGSLLMALISASTTAVLIFGFVFIFSIVSMNTTIASWGYDSSDVSLRIDNNMQVSNKEFEQKVLADPRIKNHSRLGEINGVLPVGSAGNSKPGEDSLSVIMSVVEGKYDDIGVVNLEGRNPAGPNEIAVGVNVARTLNKSIGDSLDVYIQGEKTTLTLTGIYQAIANMSYSARVPVEAVRSIQPDFDAMDAYFINLQPGTSPDSFVHEVEGKFGSAVWAATHESLVKQVFSQAVAVLVLPMTIMGLLFVIVTLVIVYSICRINIRKEQKTYGIYKSIGMTSRGIRSAVTSGTLALSAVGALAGIPLGLYGLPVLLNYILSDYGIVKMPLILNWGGIGTAVLLSFLAVGFGSWGASKVVRATSPRILTVE